MPETMPETFDEMLNDARFISCVAYLGEIYPSVLYESKFYYKKKPAETAQPCWQCEQETEWISLTLEGYICSPACAQKIHAEIREAQKRGIIFATN